MKFVAFLFALGLGLSPPARGAWIEIASSISSPVYDVVAPRTGGVD